MYRLLELNTLRFVCWSCRTLSLGHWNPPWHRRAIRRRLDCIFDTKYAAFKRE